MCYLFRHLDITKYILFKHCQNSAHRHIIFSSPTSMAYFYWEVTCPWKMEVGWTHALLHPWSQHPWAVSTAWWCPGRPWGVPQLRGAHKKISEEMETSFKNMKHLAIQPHQKGKLWVTRQTVFHPVAFMSSCTEHPTLIFYLCPHHTSVFLVNSNSRDFPARRWAVHTWDLVPVDLVTETYTWGGWRNCIIRQRANILWLCCSHGTEL